MTQIYFPSSEEARMAVAAAIVENIANPVFTDIVLFVDISRFRNFSSGPHSQAAAAREVLLSLLTPYLDDDDRVERDRKWWCPSVVGLHDDVATARRGVFAAFHNHSRVTMIPLPLHQRLTYGIAFRYAAENLEGRVVVLCNSDIAFDGSLSSLLPSSTLDLRSHVLALSKWVEEGNPVSDDERVRREYYEGRLSLVLRTDSQDAWIFRAPYPKELSRKVIMYH